jgi:hypothetical protein
MLTIRLHDGAHASEKTFAKFKSMSINKFTAKLMPFELTLECKKSARRHTAKSGGNYGGNSEAEYPKHQQLCGLAPYLRFLSAGPNF